MLENIYSAEKFCANLMRLIIFVTFDFVLISFGFGDFDN